VLASVIPWKKADAKTLFKAVGTQNGGSIYFALGIGWTGDLTYIMETMLDMPPGTEGTTQVRNGIEIDKLRQSYQVQNNSSFPVTLRLFYMSPRRDTNATPAQTITADMSATGLNVGDVNGATPTAQNAIPHYSPYDSPKTTTNYKIYKQKTFHFGTWNRTYF